MSISHELYQSIRKDVESIFKKKTDMHKEEVLDDEGKVTVIQSNCPNKLFATLFWENSSTVVTTQRWNSQSR